MQTLFPIVDRKYLGTHPWLTFTINLNGLSARDWILLGEAASKCSHVAGVPLKPEVADELVQVYLTKGVHGTTAIEGNTLTEEEVRGIVDGSLDLPPSQDYLEQEIRNILDGYNQILQEVIGSGPQPLTVERICSYNALVLRDLELETGVVPGSIRQDTVGVRRYLGAPWEDCDYLLEKLCDWLNGLDFRAEADDPFAFAKTFAKAVAAHLYLAWIHPFGDGNGRTARLIELQILIEAGLPMPATHLLSDVYNKTRSRYYEVLDRASRIAPFSPLEFFSYALEGFVDEIRVQVERIKTQQINVTWENHVHELFRDDDSPPSRRQRHVVLDLPIGEWTPRAQITELSPRVAAAYAKKQSKTVTRDLNRLEGMGLIERRGRAVRPRHESVLAFLPVRADGPVGG